MWRWGGGEGERKQIQSWSPENTKHYWKKKTFATDWLRRVRVRRGEGGSSSRQRGLSQRLANNLLQVTCKPKARDLQTCKCELCIIHLHFYIQLAVQNPTSKDSQTCTEYFICMWTFSGLELMPKTCKDSLNIATQGSVSFTNPLQVRRGTCLLRDFKHNTIIYISLPDK